MEYEKEKQSTTTKTEHTENQGQSFSPNSNIGIHESSTIEDNTNQHTVNYSQSSGDKPDNEVIDLAAQLDNLSTSEGPNNKKNEVENENEIKLELNKSNKIEIAQNDLNINEYSHNLQDEDGNSKSTRQMPKKSNLAKQIYEFMNISRIPKALEKNSPIECKVYLSVEEAKIGCTKIIEIERTFQGYCDYKKIDKRKFLLSIPPNIDNELRILLEGEGNKSLHDGKLPGDVIFIVGPAFRQINQHNIEYTARLNSSPNEDGIYKVEIPTLDNNPVTFEKMIEMFAEPQEETLVPKESYVIGNCKIFDRQLKVKSKIKILTLDGKMIKIRFDDNIVLEKNFHQILQILQTRHSNFQVDINLNVNHEATLTKSEAINGVYLYVPTSSGDVEVIYFNPQIIEQLNGIKVYHGKGMSSKDGDIFKRGDLILMYEIVDEQMKVPSKEYEVEISLEEMLSGCKKEVTITRTYLDENDCKWEEEKNITLDIEPGIEAKTKIVVSRQGDNVRGYSPGDLVFTITERPHDLFRRSGADLYYIVEMSKTQLISLDSIKIPVLDSKTTYFQAKTFVRDIFPNWGLPFAENPTQRGNLVVTYNITSNFVKDRKEILKEISENNFFGKILIKIMHDKRFLEKLQNISLSPNNYMQMLCNIDLYELEKFTIHLLKCENFHKSYSRTKYMFGELQKIVEKNVQFEKELIQLKNRKFSDHHISLKEKKRKNSTEFQNWQVKNDIKIDNSLFINEWFEDKKEITFKTLLITFNYYKWFEKIVQYIKNNYLHYNLSEQSSKALFVISSTDQIFANTSEAITKGSIPKLFSKLINKALKLNKERYKFDYDYSSQFMKQQVFYINACLGSNKFDFINTACTVQFINKIFEDRNNKETVLLDLRSSVHVHERELQVNTNVIQQDLIALKNGIYQSDSLFEVTPYEKQQIVRIGDVKLYSAKHDQQHVHSVLKNLNDTGYMIDHFYCKNIQEYSKIIEEIVNDSNFVQKISTYVHMFQNETELQKSIQNWFESIHKFIARNCLVPIDHLKVIVLGMEGYAQFNTDSAFVANENFNSDYDKLPVPVQNLVQYLDWINLQHGITVNDEIDYDYHAIYAKRSGFMFLNTCLSTDSDKIINCLYSVEFVNRILAQAKKSQNQIALLDLRMSLENFDEINETVKLDICNYHKLVQLDSPMYWEDEEEGGFDEDENEVMQELNQLVKDGYEINFIYYCKKLLMIKHESDNQNIS